LLLNEQGGSLMAELTERCLPDPWSGRLHRLAVIVDGRIHLAAPLRGRVERNILVEGSWLALAPGNLAACLNSGPLPFPLRRVERIHLDEPIAAPN
ncbi:MAG: hypothetical protein N2C14_02460, partial [Planctomycetales bacterium]